MTCTKVYDGNGVHCEGKYTTGNSGFSRKSASYSILMRINHNYCNAACEYCCASHYDKPDGKAEKELLYSAYEADYPKMIAKIKECPIYNDYNRSGMIHFDLWGGEPLYNFEALKELVSVLRKEWPECTLTVSSNGLLLGVYADWIIENKISIQLSHDGWGQWIRTQNVDPLESEPIVKGLKKINDAGLFAAINCTLSKYNYSFFKNMDYFNDKIKKYGLDKIGQIKLNHAYNSDYNLKGINTEGHWQDGFKEELKGTPIGDFGIRDDICDEYMNEFFKLAVLMRADNNDPLLKPFKSYIMEQSTRWKKVDEKHPTGACRSFQSWKYNVEGNYKQDWTFVINTVGEYCECNLCEKVDNPGSPLPEYCNDCQYSDQSECHGCGSMYRPEKCSFLKKWCQTLEKIQLMDALTNSVKVHKCK